MVPGRAVAQNPPPGAIYDLYATDPGTLDGSTYLQYSTSFMADNSSEYVSFAFREVPAFFSFDDACVTATSCSSSNLLADPGFESDTAADVYSNFPVGWGRWIQPIDTSAIGVVASNDQPYGCSAAHGGSYFWCDGSVEGFDAIYQQLNGLTPGTVYTVSWYMTDNSDDNITNPEIDMLAYAGDALPVGSQPIGPPSATPEPSSFAMLGTGVLGLVELVRRRRSRWI
jgi:hypothetical protein